MLKGLFMALIMLAIAGIGKGINKIKENHAKKKGTWTCPKCSHVNPNIRTVCDQCGEEKDSNT